VPWLIWCASRSERAAHEQQPVADWFGDDFAQLHPLLQQLHRHGGRLSGQVMIDIPAGLAGLFGRRLASRLGMPMHSGEHELDVSISHGDGVLRWDRCFDSTLRVLSLFKPVGTRRSGYWVEETGPLKMALTVDIEDGGWRWRCLSVRFLNMPLPMGLFPQSKAFKTIVGDRYRFQVGFAVPLLGTVLSYGGDLALT
jgi:Domain of unknown function (DUF4166)